MEILIKAKHQKDYILSHHACIYENTKTPKTICPSNSHTHKHCFFVKNYSYYMIIHCIIYSAKYSLISQSSLKYIAGNYTLVYNKYTVTTFSHIQTCNSHTHKYSTHIYTCICMCVTLHICPQE